MLNRDSARKIGGLLTLLALMTAGWVGAERPKLKEVTTFYLVRHAEKAAAIGDDEDVPLREQGFHRAAELRDLLRNVPLTAIYSTQYKRTRQTVRSIAEASRLELTPYSPSPSENVEDWTDQLLRKHGGDSVLIVGHSGSASNGTSSLASITQALAQRPIANIPESEYDNLYVVTIYEYEEENGQSRFERDLTRHRYGPLTRSEYLVFGDDSLKNPQEISAVVIAGAFLVVGADEDDSIQIVEAVDGDQAYRPGKTFSLDADGELDIEAIARQGDTFYVAGSHSRKRRKVEPGQVKTLKRSYKNNRKRLAADEVKYESSRRHIYRFTFDPSTGEPSEKESFDLSSIFKADKVLKAFYLLPSKEQGIDIEGIAIDGEDLYLGLRGPVLRSGWAPVLRFKLDEPEKKLEKYDLVFVNLGGRGIRDITKVDDGFLIIAGPVGDAPLSYQLYHWDGKDTIPGRRDESGQEQQGKTILLGTIPTPAGAKAEGLAVRAQEASHYEILIAYDGAENGGLTVFRVPRPTLREAGDAN
jgi:broad specificity phosphatase PhoE